MVKIYKSIFRLDFPLAYRILDKLGVYLELIKSKADNEPYSKGRGNINLLQHSLSHTANLEKNIFTLNLDLRTFNMVVEFHGGVELDNISKFPLFEFSNEIIEKLEEDHSSKYDRIGFRSYVISNKPEFSFSKIKDLLWNCNKIFGDSVVESFEKKTDIGIVLEARSEDEKNIRLTVGPYRKEERNKFFSLENDIEEGLIFDIDIWENNISIPKLKLNRRIQEHQSLYQNLTKRMENNFLEALK